MGYTNAVSTELFGVSKTTCQLILMERYGVSYIHSLFCFNIAFLGFFLQISFGLGGSSWAISSNYGHDPHKWSEREHRITSVYLNNNYYYCESREVRNIPEVLRQVLLRGPWTGPQSNSLCHRHNYIERPV